MLAVFSMGDERDSEAPTLQGGRRALVGRAEFFKVAFAESGFS